MTRRTTNNLGDLLRAAEILGAADTAQRDLIATLLGFELTAEGTTQTDVGLPGVPAEIRDAVFTYEPSSGRSTEQPTAPLAAPTASGGGEDNEAWVEKQSPKPLYRPRWFEAVKALPEVEEEVKEPLPDPLFKPEWVRTILSLVLSVTDHRGPLDFERMAESLSENEPLTVLPRLPRLRLADGVQVLIDLNESMRPFAQDQYHLLGDIKRVLLATTVTEWYFFVCPTRGVRRLGGSSDEPYRPPPHGTPVLMLTDLGATRASFGVEHPSHGEWLRFAEMVRRAGCPLVAVVPYPLSRVLPELHRAMCVVTWDRTTTTGRVQRLREGLNKEQ